MSEIDTADRTNVARKPSGGRPTRAAAAERDARLLDIAMRMFMEQGFDATSLDRLAEAAAVGKATLYARYADKAALFSAVLRRGILRVYRPLEEEFAGNAGGGDLEEVLRRVAARLLKKSLSGESIAIGRILAAEGQRFPDLAHLAIREGLGRQMGLIESVLKRFADDPRFDLGDVALAADLFASVVLGRAARLAIYGMPVEANLDIRTEAAVRLFVRGISV